ncbi:aspartyl-tRNA(Asn)/glutamyl-tRNA(Gln) amidotransferase subunit A [Pseudomonas sp. SORGH_AS 211]|uniref:amidase n=1 Tax=Pseudomonas sp. SORGH_AS_0211 TaxID=3041796 RepID=UPI0028621ADC|nr:amidase [Pseudomonas sp. SORGH_AS_0211]MDR6178064.1 aspartyl-tRNA(Asn)/glutamyl-tRNA(Gln) amidotransferase subunit A [Pseudomonas sp. SORGH_AS_0211]
MQSAHAPSLDAVGLGEAYAAGTLDPVAVFEAALARAQASSAVFITLTAERGRAEALAARERWQAGQPRSPLDGVPLAWKDLFDLQGEVTTCGAELRRLAPPAMADAILVQRLSQAGLVSLGKVNLSEFAYSGVGLNPHFGTPANPRAQGEVRIPGGSSSGSAVAVAAGIVPLALGTDTAGSVRLPAALNGLVGYRPSLGRYPATGIFPLAASYDVPGPLARSLRDVQCLDRLLTGAAARPLPAPKALRVVLDLSVLDDARVEPAVRANLLAAAERLARAGVSVERRARTVFAEALEFLAAEGWPGALEAFALHRDVLDGPAAERLDPRVRQRLERARALPDGQLTVLHEQRDLLRARFAAEFAEALLLVPTVSQVAPPLAPLAADADLFAATNLELLRLTMAGSLLGAPGVSLPSGRDAQDLPTGLLLVAPAAADERLLDAATVVEALVGA